MARAQVAQQQLFQEEQWPWVLLEAKVQFQRGKQFRQRSSWFSLSEKRPTDPKQGVGLLEGTCHSTQLIGHSDPQIRLPSTAVRVFPVNTDCYLNLSLIQNVTRLKAPCLPEELLLGRHWEQWSGTCCGFVRAFVTCHYLSKETCLTISSFSLDLVVDFSLLINVSISDRVLDSILLV